MGQNLVRAALKCTGALLLLRAAWPAAHARWRLAFTLLQKGASMAS